MRRPKLSVIFWPSPIVLLLTLGCGNGPAKDVLIQPWPTVAPLGTPSPYPTAGSVRAPAAPYRACAALSAWKGVVPGLSSREDVDRLLGTPLRQDGWLHQNTIFPFYEYGVHRNVGGIRSDLMDQVFFRADTVDWIEVVQDDSDGKVWRVKDVVSQLGPDVDVTYRNTNAGKWGDFQIDVLAGPTDVYVWAECGVALITMKEHDSPRSDITMRARFDRARHLANAPDVSDDEWHTSHSPPPNANDRIVMRFLFPPTTYTGFVALYESKVPFIP